MNLKVFYFYLCSLIIFHNGNSEKFSDRFINSFISLSKLINEGVIENIQSIVDVGANTGDWSRLIHGIFPNSSIFMIEGNTDLEKSLKATGFPYYISLVGDSHRTVTFHRHKTFHTGSSIFREEQYDKFDQSKIIVETRELNRIDDILKKNNVQKVDLFKLDIQGAEFLALLGAVETLKKATYVVLESSIHQYNRGSVQFTDINILLEHHGFRLYDIVDKRKTRIYPGIDFEGTIQADFLWIKSDSKAWTSSMYSKPPPSKYRCELIKS
mmetsp:Transcript_10897/g.11315  ORF Transcript_10897/g.11315 Transcript_10897/m.11315 type:complete len:269 (+) Transcript_10897:98-904(+)